MECGAAYRPDDPPELRPVGETEFVADAAARSDGLIAGIVGHADLRLENLDDILDAHIEAAAASSAASVTRCLTPTPRPAS